MHEVNSDVVDGSDGAVQMIEDVPLADHQHVLRQLPRRQLPPGIGELRLECGQAHARQRIERHEERAEVGRFDLSTPFVHAKAREEQM